MTTRLDHDPELDQHLRRTLAAVAATVHEAPAQYSRSVPLHTGRRRRLLVGAGVTIATIPLAAAAVTSFGPGAVDRMPPTDPIVSGSLDGERYWIVDGRDRPGCGSTPSGVELVVEEHNLVGQEWETIGFFSNGLTKAGCERPSGEPPESTYRSGAGAMVGDGMLWMAALHPDVDQVRVSLGDGEPFDTGTFDHEGGAYYVLEVPPGTATFTVEYLVDGDVVKPPSGDAEHIVPGG